MITIKITGKFDKETESIILSFINEANELIKEIEIPKEIKDINGTVYFEDGVLTI